MGTWTLIEALRRLADLPVLLRWVVLARVSGRLHELKGKREEGNDGRDDTTAGRAAAGGAVGANAGRTGRPGRGRDLAGGGA